MISTIALSSAIKSNFRLRPTFSAEKRKVKMERKSSQLFRSLISSEAYVANDSRSVSIRSWAEKKEYLRGSHAAFLLGDSENIIQVRVFLINQVNQEKTQSATYTIASSYIPASKETHYRVSENFEGETKHYNSDDAYALIKLLMNNYKIDIPNIDETYIPVYNFNASKNRI